MSPHYQAPHIFFTNSLYIAIAASSGLLIVNQSTCVFHDIDGWTSGHWPAAGWDYTLPAPCQASFVDVRITAGGAFGSSNTVGGDGTVANPHAGYGMPYGVYYGETNTGVGGWGGAARGDVTEVDGEFGNAYLILLAPGMAYPAVVPRTEPEVLAYIASLLTVIGTPPAAVKHVPYSYISMSATGGTAPYTFDVVAGALPAGLAMAADGTITGTATTLGDNTFTVRATDAYGFTGTGVFGIFVSPEPEIELPAGDTIGLSWVEVIDASGVLRTWSRVALPDPATYYGGYKEPRVLSWGRVSRSLSDDYGQPESIDFGFNISDTDRFFRASLANFSTRGWSGRSVVARMITDELRRLHAIPRTYFRGYISDYKLQSGLKVQITAQDPLAVKFSRTSETEQVPKRLITSADFPAAPTVPVDTSPDLPIAIGKPVPIIYGAISDVHHALMPGIAGALPRDLSIPAVQHPTLNGYPGTLAAQVGNPAGKPVWLTLVATRAGFAGPVSVGYRLTTAGWLFGNPANPLAVSGVRLSWNHVEGATGYRIYLANAADFDPFGAMGSATQARYIDHDAVTHDGYYATDFSVAIADWTVGTDCGGGTIDVETGVGQCPVLFVGNKNIGAYTWRQLLIAGHACKAITGVYLDNVPINLAAVAGVGGDLLVPGYAGWTAAIGAATYQDINGHRYTSIYAKGVYGDRALAPTADAPGITLNVEGIDTIGDGSGTLITDLLLQYRHCLQNWILGDYQAGAWLVSPVHSDDPDVKIVDDDSFDIASALAHERVTGGYRGDFIIGNATDGARISVRDLIAKFNISADVNAGWNRRTQFFVSMLNDTSSPASIVPKLTDASGIFKDTLEINDDLTRLWNVVPYRHTADYLNRPTTADGWLSPPAERVDTLSMKEYATPDAPAAGLRRVAPVLELGLVRGINGPNDYTGYAQGSATAADVVGRWLIRHKDPPRTIKADTGPEGLNLELGDRVRVTHYGGIGANGFVNRPVRIMRHDTDPNSLSITLEMFDLQILAEGGFILGDEDVLPDLWTAATDADRLYAYLSDEDTGKFSDGAIGKRLR